MDCLIVSGGGVVSFDVTLASPVGFLFDIAVPTTTGGGTYFVNSRFCL